MTAALAGKALLFLGCTALGVLRGQGLRQRAACLQVFRRVLAALARELAFSLRPLDQLMARAQEGSQGPVADFFRACRQAFTAGGAGELGRQLGNRPGGNAPPPDPRGPPPAARGGGRAGPVTTGRASGPPWRPSWPAWRTRGPRPRPRPTGCSGSTWPWGWRRGSSASSSCEA